MIFGRIESVYKGKWLHVSIVMGASKNQALAIKFISFFFMFVYTICTQHKHQKPSENLA